MPAFPFGGHPTLEEFIAYAQEHGCGKLESISLQGPRGEVKITYLIGANKLAVSLAGLGEPDEPRLLPRTVESLCARLGIPPFHKKD